MQEKEAKPINTKRLYKVALNLAIFTIVYNIIEGYVSTYFGYEDESLTLFGFGADSFIEAISALGIAHMILRIQNKTKEKPNNFEHKALRITAYAFYTLVIMLTTTAIYNLWTAHKPNTTLWGVIISVISISVMWVLLYNKTKIGKQLNSAAILADAECTRVCIYMSIILLVSSGIYELTNFPYIDSIGTLGLAYFSFKEGKECFENAKSKNTVL